MTRSNRNIKIKKSQNRMITMVTSVEGKPLQELVPGLKNEFRDFNDAFKTIMKHTGRRIDKLSTKRVSVASLAIGA